MVAPFLLYQTVPPSIPVLCYPGVLPPAHMLSEAHSRPPWTFVPDDTPIRATVC